jgi:hypothetical protein
LPGDREAAYREAGRALLVVANVRALDALAVRAAAALRDSGVPCLLLRGPAFARWLYADAAERPYHDVDLLVPQDRFGEAGAVIERLGLVPLLEDAAASEAEPHGATFRGSDGTIDLHWTLKGMGAPAGTVWAGLAREAAPLKLEGGSVDVPGPAARALLVAVHAAQHGARGVVQCEDLERAVASLPAATWEAAAALARELGATTWLSAGLALSPAGVPLRDRLGVPPYVDLDVAVRAEGDVPMIRGFAALEQLDGIWPRVRLLARELVPTPSFMRAWSHVAGRGRLGLIAAYLWRPVWLVLRAPRALGAYRRARRAAARGPGR